MYALERSVAIFVGPSLHAVAPDVWNDASIARELERHPPARRGDVGRLVAERPPSTIVLVDGTFYDYPSVGHAELRQALDTGWTVWGLSSMGAIRAAEMAPCGMKGFGTVYRRFAEDPEFDDDEVALLHGAEAPYHPISEPMVHLRGFVEHLVDTAALPREAAAEALHALKHRWFGTRTLDATRAWVRPRTGNKALFDALFADFDAFRAKSHDLTGFLRAKLWRQPTQ